MNKENLDRIIQTLEENSSEKDAYFEFTYENDDYCHIKSNQDGILVFAKELLRSVEDFEEMSHTQYASIDIKTNDWFIDGNVFAPYIEPIYCTRGKIINKPTTKETFKDRATGYLILGFFILLVGCGIIGFVEILSWIFN